MCKFFILLSLFLLLPWLLLVVKQIRKFTALVQTHTHTHTYTHCTQTVAIECNFAWYIKNFLLYPRVLFFRLLFGCQFCVTFP